MAEQKKKSTGGPAKPASRPQKQKPLTKLPMRQGDYEKLK